MIENKSIVPYKKNLRTYAPSWFFRQFCLTHIHACSPHDDAWGGTHSPSELNNSVADKTGQKADMAVNIPKTETMFVHGNTHKESAVAKEEAAEVVAGYDHACEFCPGKKFKTSRGLAMHQRKWCTQAAAVNNNAAVNVVEGYVINKITEVRGPPDKRWYYVEWAGLNDSAEKLHGTDPGDAWPPNWEPAAHVEGATDINGNIATDVYWGRKKNANKDGDHQDKDKPRCPHCDKECKSQRGTRMHQSKAKCRPTSNFSFSCARAYCVQCHAAFAHSLAIFDTREHQLRPMVAIFGAGRPGLPKG